MKRSSGGEEPRRTRSHGLAYLLAAVSTAFITNWFWEMLQMRAYGEMAGKTWRETVGPCTLATAGDVLLTLTTYGVGALVARDARWAWRGGVGVYGALGILGFAIAYAVEGAASALDLWSYNELMPRIPGTDAGVWPLLQLTLLNPLSFGVANTIRLALARGTGE